SRGHDPEPLLLQLPRSLVVSSRFRGKPLLHRHRLVNELLAEELKHIHAFEQRTLTPEQWEKERGGLQ
ncbi:unnamed protein product, partial [Caretta caretta]